MGCPLQGLGRCRAGAFIRLASWVRPSNLGGDGLGRGACLTQGPASFALPPGAPGDSPKATAFPSILNVGLLVPCPMRPQVGLGERKWHRYSRLWVTAHAGGLGDTALTWGLVWKTQPARSSFKWAQPSLGQGRQGGPKPI